MKLPRALPFDQTRAAPPPQSHCVYVIRRKRKALYVGSACSSAALANRVYEHVHLKRITDVKVFYYPMKGRADALATEATLIRTWQPAWNTKLQNYDLLPANVIPAHRHVVHLSEDEMDLVKKFKGGRYIIPVERVIRAAVQIALPLLISGAVKMEDFVQPVARHPSSVRPAEAVY